MKQHFGKRKGIKTRACSKCGGDLGDRYRKQSYCKACHAVYMRMNRPKYEELTEEQKRKIRTRSATNVWVKRGKIKKGPCTVCGDEKSQAHHPDYNKPLEVVWLCRKHHLELHRND